MKTLGTYIPFSKRTKYISVLVTEGVSSTSRWKGGFDFSGWGF